MKWGSLIMLIVLLQLTLTGASQTLSYSGKKVSLEDFFTSVKNQAGILFFYDEVLLRDAKPVTLNLKNVPLNIALNEAFRGQLLTWSLEGKTVTVLRRPAPVIAAIQPISSAPAILLVKGIITDAAGSPISDVSVLIKGTTHGTVSNAKGEFSLNADPKKLLVFSAINYNSRELRIEKGKMHVRLQLGAKPLELLLVGGNLNAIKRKADATTVTVLSSKTLEKIPALTVDQVFRGRVPGTNSFNIGDNPEGFPTLSIRGAGGAASLATVAVYVDGIEFAGGSRYLSQLDKNNIDRIEIVRGPGAATMFGTGSNGGIVQIFTKKRAAGQSMVNFTSSAGFIKSKWVKNDPFQQMHNLETVTGFKRGALTIGGTYRTVDAYLPDGGEQNRAFYTSIKFEVGKLHGNVIARYNTRNFGLSRNPSFDTAVHPREDIIISTPTGIRSPAYIWFGVHPTAPRYKKGLTETTITGLGLVHKTTAQWTNNLDMGFTMNGSKELPNQEGASPLQRQYAAEKMQTGTILYSNVLSLNHGSRGLTALITSGAEYKKNSAITTVTSPAAAATSRLTNHDNDNYGAFVQANPSYKNFYLTLGLRVEKNELFKAAWNPRLGLTTNFELLMLIVKPRISWGKGITSPVYENRFGRPPTFNTIVYANPEIKPQSQQGFDYGLELYNKQGNLKFEAVYYDNVIKDFITAESLGSRPGDRDLAAFIYTNICKVANRGWEFSGEFQTARFSLQGTFSIMNSILTDSTGSYIFSQLKLPPGSRLVNLPKHTAGFNLQYNFYSLFAKRDKGSVSINLTEVDGVKNIDRTNYALDVAYGRTPYSPGTSYYQTENRSVYRVGFYADYYISHALRIFVQGANILNDYESEYSNDNLTHGANWLFGIKYSFTKGN